MGEKSDVKDPDQPIQTPLMAVFTNFKWGQKPHLLNYSPVRIPVGYSGIEKNRILNIFFHMLVGMRL